MKREPVIVCGADPLSSFFAIFAFGVPAYYMVVK